MSSYNSLAFQLSSVAKIENCFRSSFGTKVPHSVTLTICYKNPHDVESAKSKLPFYTRKSTKKCSLRSPAARTTNLNEPVRWPSASAHPQLNQFYNQNLKNENLKIRCSQKIKPLTLTSEKKTHFFLFFFCGSEKNVRFKNARIVFNNADMTFWEKKNHRWLSDTSLAFKSGSVAIIENCIRSSFGTKSSSLSHSDNLL